MNGLVSDPATTAWGYQHTGREVILKKKNFDSNDEKKRLTNAKKRQKLPLCDTNYNGPTKPNDQSDSSDKKKTFLNQHLKTQQ